MTPRTSPLSPIWVAALAVSLGFLLWVNGPRRERIERVSAIAQAASRATADSPTGYADGTRELIVPERLSAAQETIALTQQMLARGDWRVRHFDRDNAPFGREVRGASPYRWWLAFVSGWHHLLQAQPLGLSVERAALYADPLLHMVWLVAASWLAARALGWIGASVVALGGALLYPFAAGFMPGVPEEHALALVAGSLSVLLLLPAWRELGRPVPPAGAANSSTSKRRKRAEPSTPTRSPSTSPRWFVAAGIAGGIGMWSNPQVQLPVLLGIGAGSLIAAWVMRAARRRGDVFAISPAAWRWWGIAGAATIVGGWLIEFAPAHLLSWELRVVHPLYAVTWLGAGELLARATGFVVDATLLRSWRDVLAAVLALLACASLPLIAKLHGGVDLLTVDPLAFRLTKQIDAAIVPNLGSWLASDGLSLRAATAMLVVFGLLITAMLAVRATVPLEHRARLALLAGPTAVAIALGYLHVRWWQMAGGCALLAFATSAAVVWSRGSSAIWRGFCTATVLACFLLGGYQQLPGVFLPSPKSLSVAEAEAIVGRHLAQWLARRSDVPSGAIVLAPPTVSSTLSYHANLRGIASLSWENKDGIGAAIRVAISTSRDETHALCQRRELNYVVLPSWDTFFDPFVQTASVQVGSLFLPSLQKWVVPPWLRPLPYEMPRIPGFEKHVVVLFELVEDQEEPLALSRLTEYFIEMSQPHNAQVIAQSLRQFPADFGALIARAQLESALGQGDAFAASVETLVKRLATGADRNLPLDRRVSLASVLARAQRFGEARTQVQRCLGTLDEAGLRSLTPYGLFHFLGLCKGFGLPIAEAELRELALGMLPNELRAKL